MTLPNPRTIYEIDPTGREDRAIVSRGIRASNGVETVCSAGFMPWDRLILASANRHVLRTSGGSCWTGTGAPRHA